jgi:hypothetical protein
LFKSADEGGLCSEFASKTSSALEDINDDEWELEASLDDKKPKIQTKQSRNTGLVIILKTCSCSLTLEVIILIS